MTANHAYLHYISLDFTGHSENSPKIVILIGEVNMSFGRSQ